MTAATPNTNERTLKAALALLRSGHATMGEVAALSGTSRQLVRHWAKREGIDARATRRAYLESAWRAAGGPRKRPPS